MKPTKGRIVLIRFASYPPDSDREGVAIITSVSKTSEGSIRCVAFEPGAPLGRCPAVLVEADEEKHAPKLHPYDYVWRWPPREP